MSVILLGHCQICKAEMCRGIWFSRFWVFRHKRGFQVWNLGQIWVCSQRKVFLHVWRTWWRWNVLRFHRWLQPLAQSHGRWRGRSGSEQEEPPTAAGAALTPAPTNRTQQPPTRRCVPPCWVLIRQIFHVSHGKCLNEAGGFVTWRRRIMEQSSLSACSFPPRLSHGSFGLKQLSLSVRESTAQHLLLFPDGWSHLVIVLLSVVISGCGDSSSNNTSHQEMMWHFKGQRWKQRCKIPDVELHILLTCDGETEPNPTKNNLVFNQHQMI